MDTLISVSDDHLDIHKLALEQGLRNLDAQRVDLQSIRSNLGGWVFGVIGLGAAFLGHGIGIDSIPSQADLIFLSFALVAFATTVFSLYSVFRPQVGWRFDMAPTSIIEQFAQGEHAAQLSPTLARLARFSEESRAENEQRIQRILHWFQVALISTLVQIAAWVLIIFI